MLFKKKTLNILSEKKIILILSTYIYDHYLLGNIVKNKLTFQIFEIKTQSSTLILTYSYDSILEYFYWILRVILNKFNIILDDRKYDDLNVILFLYISLS